MKKLVLLIALMISYQAVSQMVSYTFKGNELVGNKNSYNNGDFSSVEVDKYGKVYFVRNSINEGVYSLAGRSVKLQDSSSSYTIKLDYKKNLLCLGNAGFSPAPFKGYIGNQKIEFQVNAYPKNRWGKRIFDVDLNGALWYFGKGPNDMMPDNCIIRSSDNKQFRAYGPNKCDILYYNEHHEVNEINCDNRGNTWFLILNKGLSKYDGNTFTNYTSTNSNFPQIVPTPFICDTIGNLWFGSTEGLTKFDGTTWTNYTTANSALLSNNITTLALDHDFTSIWIGTEDGITHFDGKNWKTYTSINANLPNKLYNLSMSADTNGNLWFSNEDQNGKYPLSVLCKNFKQNLYNQVLIKKPICPGDGFVLSAPTGAANYYWSSGENTAQIQTKTPGDYNVLMYDDSGCPYMSQTLTILASDFEMNTPSICLVTNQGKYNKVVWEQLNSKNVKTYNIYKQNKQNSKYEFFKSQDANNMTEFIDSLSEASSQIDRYALSYTDTCGNESKLSSIHTTLLLSSNLGSNGTVNLAWNAYEGFSYQNFEIWRSSDGKNFNLLAYAANNTFAFIDNNPPQTAYYQVRVQNAITCNPSKRGVNTAISNTVDKDGKSINLAGLSDFTESNFIIYPNPTNNLITVSNLKSNSVISITDLNGRKIYEEIVTADKIEIPLNDLAEKGIYFINLIEKGIKINSSKIILE